MGGETCNPARTCTHLRTVSTTTKTPEQIYDEEIAPALRAISLRCEELGFPFVAQVEWKTGETGRTEFCPRTDGSGPQPRPSAKQLLTHYAARCHGNIDSMLMAVIRDAQKFGHSSAYLYILGCKNTVPPPAGSDAGLAVTILTTKAP